MYSRSPASGRIHLIAMSDERPPCILASISLIEQAIALADECHESIERSGPLVGWAVTPASTDYLVY